MNRIAMSRRRAGQDDLPPPASLPRYLDRPAAIAWLRERGIVMAEDGLKKLALTGDGPESWRLGKRIYYTEASLAAWLGAKMRRVA